MVRRIPDRKIHVMDRQVTGLHLDGVWPLLGSFMTTQIGSQRQYSRKNYEEEVSHAPPSIGGRHEPSVRWRVAARTKRPKDASGSHDGENYQKLLEQCETQELEAPGGIATPHVYSQLLALYLLHNDLNNARYLWKRIPQAIKTANPELAAVWAVGQHIWQRDFPGVYSTIAGCQWSETILPVMESLRDSTRRRAYGLVAQAYTSISVEDFASCVGYSVEEAVRGVVSHGWQADPNTRMIMPQKPDPPPLTLVPNEQQLARLTDYVAFLEN